MKMSMNDGIRYDLSVLLLASVGVLPAAEGTLPRASANKPLGSEERFVHGPMPVDAKRVATPKPPVEAFEQAGFTVKESSWDSRPLAVSRFACPWPGLDNPWVQAFRRRYDFLKHLEKGKSETEKLLLLRQWVGEKLTFGEDSSQSDPFVILDTARQGKSYVCTQYAIVMQACAVSAGWVAWNLHVDLDHTEAEPSAHHAVTEVWINELGKWVVFDPSCDSHYEKKGIMLSSVELAREWISNGGKDVDSFVGLGHRKVDAPRRKNLGGRHDAAGYFWNKRVWTWDPFRTFGSIAPDMQVGLVWDAHQGKQWYQGRPPNTYVNHTIQRGALHFTDREADVCPDIGMCNLSFGNGAAGFVKVEVETFTPGLEGFLVSIDGGPWQPAPATAEQVIAAGRRPYFEWPLHEGENALSVRTRNEHQMLGKPANVRVVLQKSSSGDEGRLP